jgi:Invasion associated locus B (IalB) protein
MTKDRESHSGRPPSTRRAAETTQASCTVMTRFAVHLALSITLFLLPRPGHAADLQKPGKAALSPADTPSEQLGTAAGWTAYTYREKSGKVCYIAGGPQKSEPAGARRKRPIAMVTHRPGEKAENVVSFAEGYPLKADSDVSVEIGSEKFDLFTKGDSAWARTSELDKAIVEAMAKGKQAVVKGTPQKGPITTDMYSLAGFAQALALIDKACEVKR